LLIRIIIFNRIVLQFTNEFLIDSVRVKDLLEKQTEKKIFILSDSTKSSCCVDMVGARHVNPDFVVHFGDACLSDNTPSNIRIEYIFPKFKLDTDAFRDTLQTLNQDSRLKQNLIVLTDIMYYYKNEEALKLVQEELQDKNILKTVIAKKDPVSETDFVPLSFGRYIEKAKFEALSEKADLLIIAPKESKIIDSLKLAKDKFNVDKVVVYDPIENSVQKYADNSKIMMKRYFMVEKAKEAEIFGILINKANLNKYKDILERTKQILNAHKKKFYLFIINKLTEPKLGNFAEIDAYIIISCPYSTFYELKDFYKVLINPFELEFVVAESKWTNFILSDAENIIKEQVPEAPENQEEETKNNNESNTQDQLIKTADNNGQLVKLDFLKTLDFHQNRTYKGLDVTIEREVHLATKGRTGLAREYDDELEQKK